MEVYKDLDAEAVRNILPPANRGADDDMLDEFLDERESWMMNYLGGTLPAGDKVMRAIVRDLAAARAMLKLATNDEERRAAVTLRDDALGRLGSYEIPSPNRQGASVHNVSPEPLWGAPEPWGRSW